MKTREAAITWWRSLSINEMKQFEAKHRTIYGIAMPHEIEEIYKKEILASK